MSLFATQGGIRILIGGPSPATVSERPARHQISMQPRVTPYLLLFCIVVLFAGCVSKHSVGYVDPAYQGQQFDSFLTYAAFKDMALETKIERAVCNQLWQTGHVCTPMLNAASPTRPQSAANRQRASHQSGADATMVIELAPHADSQGVRQLGRVGTRFRITVFDNQTDAVAARFEILVPSSDHQSPAAIRQTLAKDMVNELRRKRLLGPSIH